MALQIWLPLNGDANNLGLADFQPAIGDITYTESGKIGAKCYATGSITLSANQTASIFNNDALSIAFWIKPLNAMKNGIIFGNNDNRQFSLFQYSGDDATKHGTSLHWSWHISFDGNSWLTNVLPEGQWTHVCVTYKKPILKIYINGVLQATRTKKNSSNDAISFAYDTKIINNEESEERYINDLRIYDHCLSSNEIKILSQGLVAHYKLTNFDNNIEYDCSGYGYDGISSSTFNTINNSPRYKNCKNFENNKYIKCPTRSYEGMKDTYTFSYWAKHGTDASMDGKMVWGFHDGGYLDVYPLGGYLTWNTGDGGTNLFKNNGTSIPYPTDGLWHYYTITGNGHQTLLYIDGVYQGQAITYKSMPNSGTLFLSGWNANENHYRWNGGQISDFRIYATALSAEDIKRLYQTPISLSKTGTLNAIEYIEHDDAINNFQKTGIVSFNKITDYNLTSAVNIDDWDETKDLPLAEKMQIFANRIQSTDFIEW